MNLFNTTTKPDREQCSEHEKKSFDWAAEWSQLGTAYAQEHGTRPSTIGHVLSSNPLSLLAW